MRAALEVTHGCVARSDLTAPHAWRRVRVRGRGTGVRWKGPHRDVLEPNPAARWQPHRPADDEAILTLNESFAGRLTHRA
jgi:hypothetical protein